MSIRSSVRFACRPCDLVHGACGVHQAATCDALKPALRATAAGGGGRHCDALAVAVATAAANRSDTPKSSNIFQNPPIDMVVATAPAVPRKMAECFIEYVKSYTYL